MLIQIFIFVKFTYEVKLNLDFVDIMLISSAQMWKIKK